MNPTNKISRRTLLKQGTLGAAGLLLNRLAPSLYAGSSVLKSNLLIVLADQLGL